MQTLRVVIHGTFPGAGVGTTDTFFYRLYCYSRHNLPERYCYRAHILQKSTVVIRGTISGRGSDRIFWVVVIHGTICNFSGPLRGCCSAHILKRAIRLPGKDRLLFTAHFAGFFSFRVLLCSAQFPFCRILCAAFPAISFLKYSVSAPFYCCYSRHNLQKSCFYSCYPQHISRQKFFCIAGLLFTAQFGGIKGQSCYVRHISNNPKILFFELLSDAHFPFAGFFPAEL